MMPIARAATTTTVIREMMLWSITTFGATAQSGRVNLYNGGGEFFSICGHFAFAGDHADVLLGILPPIVHLYRESDKASLRWCVDQIMYELQEPRPGNSLVLEYLAHMMLIQALRLHITSGSKGSAGFLFALADREVSVAIKCMHDDPARRWTLRSLAESAAMSRTAFTVKFKKVVGTTPMEYLTQWRMLLAADKPSNARNSVSMISASLGYESESAFSTAFKRIVGFSPREFSRRQNLPAGHDQRPAATVN
ncbi:MAG TPA: AraC family transcriptional regulator [Candidatus Binatia bacterium]|nr:AraC family transcriptional regulator [Candidatus Binatia bacterium]